MQQTHDDTFGCQHRPSIEDVGALHGFHSRHDALRLRIEAAAETHDESKERNLILCTANFFEGIISFEFCR